MTDQAPTTPTNMTTAQAKGMLRLHETMASAFREYDQPENLETAERRAAHCRGVLAAADKEGA